MIPACAWCNGKKGDMSLGEWLHSNDLELRRSVVIQREPDAEPMHPKILDQLKDEDINRLRQILNYHADT